MVPGKWQVSFAARKMICFGVKGRFGARMGDESETAEMKKIVNPTTHSGKFAHLER